MDQQAIAFGKYVLLERLGADEIADLFKAKTRKADGSEIQVLIKRIPPETSSNESFASIFLEEAQHTSGMNHPNLAKIYEWGKQDESFFMALEYIEGTNLGSLMQSVAEQSLRFPPTMGLYIVIELLKSLTYAHELTDAYGNPLHLVHRAVCPPNIVLSSTGEVKLVGFGLAKATSHIRPSLPGVLRGDYSYLAPEQIRQQPADGRADLFAVGVILYEVLTGIKLQSTGDADGISRVVGAVFSRPPSSVHRDIPVELDQLIQKAMGESAATRHPNARSLQEALSKFLTRWDRRVDTGELAAFLRETFSGRAMDKPKHAGFAFGEATSQWLAQGEDGQELKKRDLSSLGVESQSAGRPTKQVSTPEPNQPAAAIPADIQPQLIAPRRRFSEGSTVMAVEASGLGKSRWLKTSLLLLGGTALLVLALVFIIRGLSRSGEVGGKKAALGNPAAERFAGEVELRCQPENLLVLVDGDPVKSEGQPPKLVGIRAGTHRIKLAAPGFLPWEGDIDLEADKPGLIEQKLTPRQGRVQLISNPAKAKILLDGKFVGLTPKTFDNLEVAKTYKLGLLVKGFAPMNFSVGPLDWPEDPQAIFKIEKTLEKPKPKRR